MSSEAHEQRLEEAPARAPTPPRQPWRLIDSDEATLQQLQASLLAAQTAGEAAIRQSQEGLRAAITAGDWGAIEQYQAALRQQQQQWRRLHTQGKRIKHLLKEQQLFQRMAQRLGSSTRAIWFERTVSVVVALAIVLALVVLTLPLPATARWWIGTLDLLLAALLIAEFFFRYSQAPDERWFWRRYWLDLLASIPLQPLLRLGRLWRLGRFARVWQWPWLTAWWQDVTFVVSRQVVKAPPLITTPEAVTPTALAGQSAPAAIAPTTVPEPAPLAPAGYTPRQQAAHFGETATVAAAIQRLTNQQTFDAIAMTTLETLMTDFHCVQAAIYWLVPRTRQLRQIQQSGAGQRFPTQVTVNQSASNQSASNQVMNNEGLLGALIAQTLAKTEVATSEIKPALAPGAVTGETVMIYPLVAGQRVIGALVLVTDTELARYYEYTRTPLILAHCTALALHGTEK